MLFIENKRYLGGIDISHHNGKINWQRLLKYKKYLSSGYFNINYVIHKATEKDIYIDSKLYSNYQNLLNYDNIGLGFYHFFRSDCDHKKQIEYFSKQIKNFSHAKRNIALFLDIETNHAKIDKICYGKKLVASLNMLENEFTKYKIGIYTNTSFWNQNIEIFQDFSKYILWLARYYNNDNFNVLNNYRNPCLKYQYLPKGFKKYDIWQFTDKGKFEEIEGYFDLNIMEINNFTNIFCN